jgi:hypothetical protein
MVEGLPVHGYKDQTHDRINLVNTNKIKEEQMLRLIDSMMEATDAAYDKRWLSIARTHFEQGYMALNRSIFCPQRIELPPDGDC